VVRRCRADGSAPGAGKVDLIRFGEDTVIVHKGGLGRNVRWKSARRGSGREAKRRLAAPAVTLSDLISEVAAAEPD